VFFQSKRKEGEKVYMKFFSRSSPIVFRDAPSLSLTLPDEASFWCYGRVTACFSEKIAFRAGKYEITLIGEGLRIGALSENEAWIRGKILDLHVREAKE